MSENIFFAAFFFPCTAAVIIFAFKYASGIVQARARLAQDGAYQELARSMAASQAAAALAAPSAATAQIQARPDGLEKILKEVE